MSKWWGHARTGAAPGAWAKALAERGILVRDMGEFAGLEGSVRITIGTAEQNAKLLEALDAIR